MIALGLIAALIIGFGVGWISCLFYTDDWIGDDPAQEFVSESDLTTAPLTPAARTLGTSNPASDHIHISAITRDYYVCPEENCSYYAYSLDTLAQHIAAHRGTAGGQNFGT